MLRACRTYSSLYTTPPWGVFPRPIARQPRGSKHRTTRLRKALGEMFPTPTVLTTTLFHLWRYRPWKIGQGGYDRRRRIRCISCISDKSPTARAAPCGRHRSRHCISRPFRTSDRPVHDLDLSGLIDPCDLYNLAHVAGCKPYNPHDPGPVSWVGSVLHRSWTDLKTAG